MAIFCGMSCPHTPLRSLWPLLLRDVLSSHDSQKLLGPYCCLVLRDLTHLATAITCRSLPVEYTGPACVAYQQFFTPAFMQYYKDQSAEVRQAVAYGCGLLAQFGGDQFSMTCAQFVPLMVEVITDPSSREPENLSATENAVSAISKILQYNSSAVQKADELLNSW